MAHAEFVALPLFDATQSTAAGQQAAGGDQQGRDGSTHGSRQFAVSMEDSTPKYETNLDESKNIFGGDGRKIRFSDDRKPRPG
jgi:hypothetical protein